MNRYIMPIHFVIGKKKIFLGMNWYRNAHYFTQSKAKKIYHEMIIEQLDDNVIYEKIRLEIVLNINKLVKKDLGNITSIHEKCFLDALVENKNITDDCLKYHLGTTTCYIVDKSIEVPYVSIKIIKVS